MLNTTTPSTLDRLKAETLDYLTGESNNQVRGFYEFSGYWERKDRAMSQLDNARKEHLAELFDFMSSITIEQLAEATRTQGREWLRKYGTHWSRGGRISDSEHYAMRQSGASTHSKSVINNYEILRRARWHIGAVLNRLTESEVRDHIEAVATSELQSTTWPQESSRFSNAIFRLEIALSWLAGTDHENIARTKLAEVAAAWLKSKNIDIASITGTEYEKAMTELRARIVRNDGVIAGHKEAIKDTEEDSHKARAEMREQDKDISGMRLTELLKLRDYINGSAAQ